MKIIQEDNFADIMKDEVEPYLYAHCRECYITGAKEPERREKNGKLHVKFYETDRPKGVIIISHGFTEGAQKYDSATHLGAVGRSPGNVQALSHAGLCQILADGQAALAAEAGNDDLFFHLISPPRLPGPSP